VKTINASRYAQAYPRVVQGINEYHYVDDYVDSLSDEKEAIALSAQVRKMHAEAVFDLCRFSSSSESVVKALNPLHPKKIVINMPLFRCECDTIECQKISDTKNI